MTNNPAISPNSNIDPRPLLVIILLLILASALSSCRSTKSSSQTTRLEQSTEQSAHQRSSTFVDSLISSFLVRMDTLDIWFLGSTPYPSLQDSVDSAPCGNSLQSAPRAKPLPTESSQGGPLIRSPTFPNVPYLHVRAVGLQTLGTNTSTHKQEDTTSDTTKKDTTSQNKFNTQATRAAPFSVPTLMLAIVGVLAIVIAGSRLYKRY